VVGATVDYAEFRRTDTDSAFPAVNEDENGPRFGEPEIVLMETSQVRAASQ